MTAAKSGSATNTQSKGFSSAEKAAAKARVAELKAEERISKNRAEGEKAAQEAIAAMAGTDGAMARRLHELIKANVPELMPKTWYGMPAYANAEGKIVCFFKPSQKFGARYSTFGFNDSAHLDDGDLWPTEFAVMTLTPAAETKILGLVRKAAG